MPFLGWAEEPASEKTFEQSFSLLTVNLVGLDYMVKAARSAQCFRVTKPIESS